MYLLLNSNKRGLLVCPTWFSPPIFRPAFSHTADLQNFHVVGLFRIFVGRNSDSVFRKMRILSIRSKAYSAIIIGSIPGYLFGAIRFRYFTQRNYTLRV